MPSNAPTHQPFTAPASIPARAANKKLKTKSKSQNPRASPRAPKSKSKSSPKTKKKSSKSRPPIPPPHPTPSTSRNATPAMEPSQQDTTATPAIATIVEETSSNVVAKEEAPPPPPEKDATSAVSTSAKKESTTAATTSSTPSTTLTEGGAVTSASSIYPKNKPDPSTASDLSLPQDQDQDQAVSSEEALTGQGSGHDRQPDALLLLEDICFRSRFPLNYDIILQHQVIFVDVPSASSHPVSALAKSIPPDQSRVRFTTSLDPSPSPSPTRLQPSEPEEEAPPPRPRSRGFLKCWTVVEMGDEGGHQGSTSRDVPFSLFMSTGDWADGAAILDIKFFREGCERHFASSEINLTTILENRDKVLEESRGDGGEEVNIKDEIIDRVSIVSVKRGIRLGFLGFKMVFGEEASRAPAEQLLNMASDLSALGPQTGSTKALEIQSKSNHSDLGHDLKKLIEKTHSELLAQIQSKFPTLLATPTPDQGGHGQGHGQGQNVFNATKREGGTKGGSRISFDLHPSEQQELDFYGIAQDFDLASCSQTEKSMDDLFSIRNYYRGPADNRNNNPAAGGSGGALLCLALTPGERERRDMKIKIKEAEQFKAKVKAPTSPIGLVRLHRGLEEKVAELGFQVSSYSSKLMETEAELMGLRDEVTALRKERGQHLQILENSCEKIDSLKRSLALATMAEKESERVKEKLALLEKKTEKSERVNRLIQVMTSSSPPAPASGVSDSGSVSGSPSLSAVLDKIEASLGLESMTFEPPSFPRTTPTRGIPYLPPLKPSQSRLYRSGGGAGRGGGSAGHNSNQSRYQTPK